MLWYFDFRGKVGDEYMKTFLYYFATFPEVQDYLKIRGGRHISKLILFSRQILLINFRACLWLYTHQVQAGGFLTYVYLYLSDYQIHQLNLDQFDRLVGVT